MKVWDKWYPDTWGQGVVKKIMKTRIIVSYQNAHRECHKEITYDKVHVRNFLMCGNVWNRFK